MYNEVEQALWDALEAEQNAMQRYIKTRSFEDAEAHIEASSGVQHIIAEASQAGVSMERMQELVKAWQASRASGGGAGGFA